MALPLIALLTSSSHILPSAESAISKLNGMERGLGMADDAFSFWRERDRRALEGRERPKTKAKSVDDRSPSPRLQKFTQSPLSARKATSLHGPSPPSERRESAGRKTHSLGNSREPNYLSSDVVARLNLALASPPPHHVVHSGR